MAKRATKGKRKSSASLPVSGDAARLISIVLIDDNRVLQEGLVAMLHKQPGFKALAASADESEALEQVRAAKPDIVLIDFGLVDNDSLGITTKVRAEVPDAKLIVMGLLTTEDDVADYVRAGASGFVMKDATFEELTETIRAVAEGGDALPRTLTPALFEQIVSDDVADSPEPVVVDSVVLTRREQEVVSLIGEGLTNKECATRLNIAVHTVKSHVHNVLKKLALRSRLEVAVFAHAKRPADRKKQDGA